MSDCFNHAADAMDSYISCYAEGLEEGSNFTPRTYITIDVDEFVTFTEKAVLVKISNNKFWIPVSQVRGCTDTSIEITKWVFERLEPIKEEK